MESSFYVIILLLIFLKLMIWLCVFYSRSRRRQALSQRGVIIVQGEVLPTGTHLSRDRDGIVTNEHNVGIYPGGVDNPIISAPPSYEEVQRTKSMEEKPPSYDQIASYYTMQSGDTGMPQCGSSVISNTGSDVQSNNPTPSAQLPAYSPTDENPSRNHMPTY